MENQWHATTIDNVESALHTNQTTGLETKEANRRLHENGRNELPERKKDSELKKFILHFNDVLIYVLLAAALITALLGHYIDTSVILLVTIINAFIGYIQESQAEKALSGIKAMLSLSANVRRNGERLEMEAAEVVVGDVVVLSAGDKVPADIRLIEAHNLRVEESALTGESTAVDKQTDVLDTDTVLNDRTNMVFSGTSVAAGSGVGIVTATGPATELGKINEAMAAVEYTQTPLLRQIAAFGKTIALFVVGIAVVMFLFGYLFRGFAAGELLLSVIALAVAAIPEGLPAILSIILAIGVKRMARRNAIIRSLPSVETLGSVSVICSDKTGTLTKNEMTVTTVETTTGSYSVTGTGYAPDGEIVPNAETGNEASPVLERFLACVQTCNDASLRQDDDGQWTIDGDPTDGCFLTLVRKTTLDLPRYTVVSKIPFDSEYKYMAVLAETNGKRVLFVKGAPDQIFAMAEQNSDVPFDRVHWEKQMSARANSGERVLAAGYKEMPAQADSIGHHDLAKGVTFLGLAGIVDPPREEAIAAVQACKKAGIQVKMITGDHGDTAKAIGKQLGIGDGAKALTGKELDQMSDEELDEAATNTHIFARTSPENKLRLVKSLQKQGHICAMTGDGVNDAAALKRADIGVAMGIKGTEVTKDAAKMVLADDNFQTIVHAVEEGRRVYDNVKKTILFILPTNGAGGILIVASIFLGMSMPLTPVQILWVNMVVAITVSLGLAFEQLERGAMQRPPRDPKAKLLSPYYLFRITAVSAMIGIGTLWMNHFMQTRGYEGSTLQTIILQMFVMAQLFYMFNCRSELDFAFNRSFFQNKVAFAVAFLLLLLQLALTYIPFMNTVFQTTPLTVGQWAIPILMGLFVFTVVEIEKRITKTLSQNSR
ncbi:carbonate dehydratase [Shouchella clausii]|uniref:cation-transporting P-type ATPase n=1 Tax=Shouchella clausii TaxID=79880 RepID=UPI000BA6B93A|nr:cation-transporting P-type ATPase [Shouchella clausii]PAF09443.1 carbonate dehydratase [Shouchella clausii]